MIYSAVTDKKDLPRSDVKCFGVYDKFKEPRRNAKIYKALPHLFLDTEWSIWVDGNVTLKVEPEVLLEMLGDKDIGVFTHPDRHNIYEEAEVCKQWGLDDPKTIDTQINRYKKEKFTDEKLGFCCIVVRKHTKEIERLNEKWWAEICRGSVRDQISFPYVFKDKVKYFNKPMSNNNEFFKRTGHQKK